ncbi:ATP synthase F1 subunit delta [Mycoplasma sp. P36-A1]|uniref:ATP synthase F1 subunit delta n=1 Tax=Mycoplasma sp. P36-A1 TaxID=3252900 RepID=UPI003C2CA032
MEAVSVAYANAMFDLALEDNKQDIVLEQMSSINEIISSNKDLVKILESKNLSKINKKEMIENIFSNILDKDVLNFLKLLVDKSRVRYIVDITKAYKNAYLKHYKIHEAIIYSTKELNQTQLEEIKDALENKYNQKYVAINRIDETLLAGIKVVINDLVIDGSIANKLDRMKTTILKK